jgi:taurine--2-oxoglutarate transaminase
VVPPCTISEADLDEGLRILDDVLTLADAHTTAGAAVAAK